VAPADLVFALPLPVAEGFFSDVLLAARAGFLAGGFDARAAFFLGDAVVLGFDFGAAFGLAEETRGAALAFDLEGGFDSADVAEAFGFGLGLAFDLAEAAGFGLACVDFLAFGLLVDVFFFVIIGGSGKNIFSAKFGKNFSASGRNLSPRIDLSQFRNPSPAPRTSDAGSMPNLNLSIIEFGIFVKDNGRNDEEFGQFRLTPAKNGPEGAFL
tara:strand:+ start:210 stop:845 length:636 start_codon:yes stop_codon:yes gene_type:complete